jgi:hypothetical protein
MTQPSRGRIPRYDIAMPPANKTPDSQRKLIGNLTVADARHTLLCEGGGLTLGQLAFELISVVIVAAFTARAIVVGNATAWHLVLPMVAQYFALIFALPPLFLILQHPDLRKDALGSLRLTIGFTIAIAITIGVRAHQAGVPWQQQLNADASAAWKWVTDAEMQWPIAIACLGILAALPGRVHNLYKHGPPFSGVSLGCGMRFVVLMLGGLVLPWALEDRNRMAWTLWTMFLIAEVLTFWMLWDIQTNLKKVDAEIGDD